MRLAKKYADHWAELLSTVQYIAETGGGQSPNAIRLGISAEEVTNILNLNAAFQAAYGKYTDPETHNAISVREMAVTDKAVYAVILPLRRRLKNGVAPLTSEDYAHLFIHEDKQTQTPAPPPAYPPVLSLRSAIVGSHQYSTNSAESGKENVVALPQYCRLQVALAITAAGETPAEADFRIMTVSGKARFTVDFDAADKGKVAHVKCRYINTRQATSQWSNVRVNGIV